MKKQENNTSNWSYFELKYDIEISYDDIKNKIYIYRNSLP